jgi:hypothetical protein
MPQLADVQSAIARAMLTGDTNQAPAALVGGANVAGRLDIHLRHYRTSLQSALLEKFPATAWLLGSEFVTAAALVYLRQYPPQAPCIAEFGAGFPGFIARHKRALALPYVESFAALEWALGRVSIAVDALPLAWDELASTGPDQLLNSRLGLQPGLHYLRAAHSVDALMRVFLSRQAPESFAMNEVDAPIEVLGSRGDLRMTRLDPGSFGFRQAVCRGESISIAAGLALDADDAFDAGMALRQLVNADLVIAVHV